MDKKNQKGLYNGNIHSCIANYHYYVKYHFNPNCETTLHLKRNLCDSK